MDGNGATIYRMMRLAPEQLAGFDWPDSAREHLREVGYLGALPSTSTD